MNNKNKNWTMAPVRPEIYQLIRIEAAKRNMRISDLIAEYVIKNREKELFNGTE